MEGKRVEGEKMSKVGNKKGKSDDLVRVGYVEVQVGEGGRNGRRRRLGRIKGE